MKNSKEPDQKPENPHVNHRSRLKNRFLAEGLTNFDDHLILELLLFYSIARRDTNGIAHDLLKNFKSLAGVFDADIHELEACDGIGENSAVLIKMIPQLARAYMMSKCTSCQNFNAIDKIGEYLVNYYIGCIYEKVLLIMLNNNMEMISCEPISEGSVNSANFPVRIVVDKCVKRNAACFIIAHNHPGGSTMPSDEDLELTKMLLDIFEKLNIPLIEHIIVAGGRYNTILRSF